MPAQLRKHFLHHPIVINNHIGPRHAFGVGKLCIEPAFDHGTRAMVTLHGTRDGGLAVDDDNPGFVAPVVPAGFKQHGGFEHNDACCASAAGAGDLGLDRKSTRLNSSH